MPPLSPAPVSVDGVRTAVLAGGPTEPGAPAVVLVHGNPGSAEHWRDLAERLDETVRVVAPDLPGFGGSAPVGRDRCSPDGFAQHLDGVLAAAGVDRAHLVLHDIGGLVGLLWAAEHVDRVASLTLVDTGVLRDYRPHAMAVVWRAPGLGELAMRGTTERLFRLLLRRGQPRPLPEPFLAGLWRDFAPGRTRRTVLGFYRSIDVDGLVERADRALSAFDGPVLVVWGRADAYVGVEHAERQRATFPQAQVVVLDRSGHWPMGDDPDGFAATVLPFLGRAGVPV